MGNAMQKIPEYISLSDAVQATEKDRTSIFRKLTHKDPNKRLIGKKDGDGKWLVLLNSLTQYYQVTPEGIKFLENKFAMEAMQQEPLQNAMTHTLSNTKSNSENTDLTTKIQLLEQDLEHKKEIITEKQSRIEELQTDKATLGKRLEEVNASLDNQTRLLTYQKEQEEPASTPRYTGVLLVFIALVLVAILALLGYSNFFESSKTPIEARRDTLSL